MAAHSRPGAAEALAHLAVVAVLHRLGVVGIVYRIGFAVLLVLERRRRVDDGVGEIGRKLRKARLHLVETVFRLALEPYARKLRTLDGLVQNAHARRVAAVHRGAHRLRALVQRDRLRNP